MDDEFICDEEKSYNDWVSNNLSYINQNKQSIGVMKKMYMIGFAAGFMYRKELNCVEKSENDMGW